MTSSETRNTEGTHDSSNASSRNSLRDPRVAEALETMFAAAEQDAAHQRELYRQPANFEALSSKERADAAAEIYMPISRDGGRLIYTLIRAARPRTVVEFGTSFGISTLHLAAAVRDNGVGRVITTELSASKAAAARDTFARTGLADVITVLEGDALETLAAHLDASEPVDFLLLDGWKDLYLPVLHLLEPRLRPGALIFADDTEFESVQPYLAYMRNPATPYEGASFPVEDGMEVSCRL